MSGRWGVAAAVVRPAPGLFALDTGLALAAGLLTPAGAWALAELLGRVADGAAASVAGPALGVALAAAGVALTSHLSRFVQAELARRLVLHARAEISAWVNRMVGIEALESPAFLDRLRLAQHAGATAPALVVRSVAAGARAGATIAGFCLALATVAAWLPLVCLLAGAPAALLALAESRRRADHLAATSPRVRREMFYGSLLTDARAAKEIRLFGTGEFLRSRMIAELTAIGSGERRLDRRTLLAQSAVALAGALIAGAALVWAAVQAGHGRITVGQLSVTVAALVGMQAATAALARAVADGYRGMLTFRHYVDLRDELAPAPVTAVPAAAPAVRATPAVRAGIEFRGVSFAYPNGEPVLRELDFVLPGGQMTALVGLNGAGKSTLVKLLCRLYEPDTGTILWDGVDIATLDPAGLRSRVAGVFQDYMCYDLTGAENIGLGELARLHDRAALRAAARASGAHAVLSGLRSGYDTMLSRAFRGADGSGAQLSGGQWQRVALARALLRSHAELLILDEPTAGLDAEAEAAMDAGLRERHERVTTLLISHRLNLVRNADLILVLAGGRLVERGSHTQLLARGGDYARLFARQAAGYAPSPAA